MRTWLLQGGIMTVCGLLFGLILRGVASRGLHAPYRGFSLKTVLQMTIIMTLGATFLPVVAPHLTVVGRHCEANGDPSILL